MFVAVPQFVSVFTSPSSTTLHAFMCDSLQLLRWTIFIRADNLGEASNVVNGSM